MLLTDDPFQLANIHETEGPRAVAAVDISLRVTVVLAPECHERVTHHKLRIDYVDDELKCNGPLQFTGRTAQGEVYGLDRPFISKPTVSPQEARQTDE